MPTTREVTQRYLSDTRAIHDMHDNGFIDSFQHDEWIEQIDNRFFAEIEMLDIVTPTAQLERIMQYSAAA